MPILRSITIALHDSIAYQHIFFYQWPHVERAEKNHEHGEHPFHREPSVLEETPVGENAIDDDRGWRQLFSQGTAGDFATRRIKITTGKR